MFAAVDEALARLYPTRRWGERDEETALGEGVSPEEWGGPGRHAGHAPEDVGTLYRPGGPEEWCDYIYVLCLGRTPCIADIRAVAGAGSWPEEDVVAEALAGV